MKTPVHCPDCKITYEGRTDYLGHVCPESKVRQKAPEPPSVLTEAPTPTPESLSPPEPEKCPSCGDLHGLHMSSCNMPDPEYAIVDSEEETASLHNELKAVIEKRRDQGVQFATVVGCLQILAIDYANEGLAEIRAGN